MSTVTQSSSLTRPVRLRYLESPDGPDPIEYLASRVVPGRAGPALPVNKGPEPASESESETAARP